DLHAGHRDRQPRVKRDHPADGGRLAVRVAVPQDHVVHRGRVEPGPAEQPAQRDLTQLGRGERFQRAAVPADRGPDRFTDHYLFTHEAPPSVYVGLHTRRHLVKPYRSMLFVPGHKPSWADKAIAAGTDAIILDLEDSVPAADKAMARQAVR